MSGFGWYNLEMDAWANLEMDVWVNLKFADALVASHSIVLSVFAWRLNLPESSMSTAWVRKNCFETEHTTCTFGSQFHKIFIKVKLCYLKAICSYLQSLKLVPDDQISIKLVSKNPSLANRAEVKGCKWELFTLTCSLREHENGIMILIKVYNV